MNRLRDFRNTMIASFLVALSIAILIPSYVRLFASEVFVFRANDGWCNPRTQGIGVHCFGDFYYHLNFLGIDYPYASGNAASPYPPVGLFFFKPFEILLKEFPNSHIALTAYFMTLIFAILSPVFYLKKILQLHKSEAAILAFFSIGLSPILISIDRGNNVAFLMPLFFFFCIFVINSNYLKAGILVILMSLIKPQMLISVIVFAVLRKYRLTAFAILTSFFIHLLGFFALGGSIKRNLEQFWVTFSYQQQFWKPGSINPPNISISNFKAVVERVIFGRDFEASYIPTWIVGTLLVAILINMHINAYKMSKFRLLTIASLLPTALPNVGGPYYLSPFCSIVVILIAQSFVVEDESRLVETKIELLGQEVRKFLAEHHFPFLIIFAVIVLVPWTVPISLFGIKYISAFTSIQWILGAPIMAFYLLALSYNRTISRTKNS